MRTLPQSHVADLESASGGRQVPTTSPGESPVESTDVGSGAVENKLRLGRNLRVCRICHLYTDATNQDSGQLFELGCSCREDLAVAHKQCTEAWFKIKGNNGLLERSSGKFLRRFRLPEGAKVEEIKAAMENRVLTVTVPKVEIKKPQAKAIDISG